MVTDSSFELILVGGGLQNSLIALAVLARRPNCRLALIERESNLGGNHTWCFHAGDIPFELEDAVWPLVVYDWPGYRVQFPGLARELNDRYAGTTSERLNEVVTQAIVEAPNAELFCGAEATLVSAGTVVLGTGLELTADLVIDARGPDAFVDPCGAGFQKFVGVELLLEQPHGLDRPILIDATVPQRGGFRFFYTLPLGERHLLVEDTIFSRDRSLNVEEMERGCLDYAQESGYLVESVGRRESGALPMPWEGQYEAPQNPLRAGYQGGWFHPATGYSFPVAARLAQFVAARPLKEVIGPELDTLYATQMAQVRFCHRLNRMLFAWFHEGDEWNVFERFYRMSPKLIRRFYALRMTKGDMTRMVVGRPPRGFSLRARLSRRNSA